MPGRAKSFSAARDFRRFKWRPGTGTKGDIPEGRLHKSSRRQLSPPELPVPALSGFPLLLSRSSGAVPGAGSVSCCPPCVRARSIPASQEAGAGVPGSWGRFPGTVGDPAHPADTELRMFRNKIPHSGTRQRLQKCLEQRGLSPTLFVHLRFVPKATSAALGAQGFPSLVPEPAPPLHCSASRG